MILVDTSVWIDHLRRGDPGLVAALEDGLVAQHPMVIGELSLGNLRDRTAVLTHLRLLPAAVEASHAEVDHLVEQRHLAGRGLSLVDAHLLASTVLTPEGRLWTRDKLLRTASDELGVAH